MLYLYRYNMQAKKQQALAWFSITVTLRSHTRIGGVQAALGSNRPLGGGRRSRSARTATMPGEAMNVERRAGRNSFLMSFVPSPCQFS